ncbi:MAG: GTPase domain-containing protein [Candidatus Hodarchaeales archaeon]
MPDTSPSSSTFQVYNKIVFLGKRGVEKSLLIQRLLGYNAKSKHDSLEIEYHNLELEYQNKVNYLQFWDLSSHFEENLEIFLQNASLVIFVFDFNDKESQRYLRNLYDTNTSLFSSAKLIFVGITKKEGKLKTWKDFTNWIKEKSFVIHPTFLLKNEGISQLLQTIVQIIDKEKAE